MNIEETLDLMHSIGLTKAEQEIIVLTDEPKIPGYLCFPSTEIEAHYTLKDVFGQGYDPDRMLARLKAVGESLERLCLYNPDKSKFLYTRYKKNQIFVNPKEFCCYSEEQVTNLDIWKKKAQEGKYHWWPVLDIITKKKALLPAQMVFLSSDFDDEFQIRPERISTGAAFGPSQSSFALENGLMEVVERDSCISSYLSRKKIKRIIDLPEDLSKLTTYLSRYRLESYLFDVTSDLGIPSVLSVVIDPSGIGPAINIGSRASKDFHSAIKSAILESIHCRRTSRVMRELGKLHIPNEGNIDSLDQRFYFWHPLERIKDLHFWLDHPETLSYSDLRSITFDETIEVFRKRNFHIFVADITPENITSRGFQILKVIIPELHPLYLDERAKVLHSVHYGSIKEDTALKPHPFT